MHASPVGKSVAASRGASMAGEAFRRAGSWAAATPQTATFGVGVASGVAGTIAGEAARLQLMLPDSASDASDDRGGV